MFFKPLFFPKLITFWFLCPYSTDLLILCLALFAFCSYITLYSHLFRVHVVLLVHLALLGPLDPQDQTGELDQN